MFTHTIEEKQNEGSGGGIFVKGGGERILDQTLRHAFKMLANKGR